LGLYTKGKKVNIMNIYTVKGTVSFEHECDCEDCYKNGWGTDKLSYQVEAVDEKQAVKLALKKYEDTELSRNDVNLDWAEPTRYEEENPVVTFDKEITEEILMLRQNQHTLWGLLQTA
jgi:hypothetical protein